MFAAASETSSSRHRKAQRLAAAAHIDRRKARRGEAAAGTIALFAGFELVLAGAELSRPAPVQWPVLYLDGAVVGIDGFREAEDPLRLAGDVGMQAPAGLDPIPAAAYYVLFVSGRDR